MPNYENFFQFEYWQYEVIRHIFSLTFGVFAAALVYFGMTMKTVLPRYRRTAAISAVVMVSAFLEILALWYLWNIGFEYDRSIERYVVTEGHVFANGNRYANWMIDVPMLLTQFLVVLGFTGAAFMGHWRKLTIAGLAMIITGYIGQYYEPQVAGFIDGNGMPFWIWGGISWLIFFYLLYAANNAFKGGINSLQGEAQKTMRLAWRILYVSWFLYGFAYMVPGIPGLGQDADWVVVRQLIYTVADIVSKAVFGVVLARAAEQQSAIEDARYTHGEPEPGTAPAPAQA